MNQTFSRLINLALIIGGLWLANKAQTDPRYAWLIPALPLITAELPSTGIINKLTGQNDKRNISGN